ncbi:putative formin, FH2 domain-containing protein [Helianthus anomalus]
MMKMVMMNTLVSGSCHNPGSAPPRPGYSVSTLHKLGDQSSQDCVKLLQEYWVIDVLR